LDRCVPLYVVIKNGKVIARGAGFPFSSKDKNVVFRGGGPDSEQSEPFMLFAPEYSGDEKMLPLDSNDYFQCLGGSGSHKKSFTLEELEGCLDSAIKRSKDAINSGRDVFQPLFDVSKVRECVRKNGEDRDLKGSLLMECAFNAILPVNSPKLLEECVDLLEPKDIEHIKIRIELDK
jgi:hypothetical protein